MGGLIGSVCDAQPAGSTCLGLGGVRGCMLVVEVSGVKLPVRGLSVWISLKMVRVSLILFSSRRRHTRYWRDWSSDVCSSDLLTRDPMLGAGHCIVALQSLVSRNVDPLDSAVVSVTVAEAGEAQNQVPHRAVLKGTMRFLRDATGDALEEGLRRVADGVAAAFGLVAAVRVRRGVAVTANRPAERDLAAAAAGAVGAVRRDLPPAMTGEDFSWFLEEVPGAFAWIGNGSAEG